MKYTTFIQRVKRRSPTKITNFKRFLIICLYIHEIYEIFSDAYMEVANENGENKQILRNLRKYTKFIQTIASLQHNFESTYTFYEICENWICVFTCNGYILLDVLLFSIDEYFYELCHV